MKIDGALFDGQVALTGLRISRQRKKVIRGKVAAHGLDLGTLANLVPGVAFNGSPPRGTLSATLDLKNLPLAAPQLAELSLVLEALDVAREGSRAKLLGADQAAIDAHRRQARGADFKLGAPLGLRARRDAGGGGRGPPRGVRPRPRPPRRPRARRPGAPLRRHPLGRPRGRHALGRASAWPARSASLRYAGSAELQKGELALKGVPVALGDMTVDVDITGGDVRLKKAFARVGGGTVQATGRLPLRGPEAGSFLANITARGVKVPVADGINLTADAELEASYRPAVDAERGRRAVPDVKGTVSSSPSSATPAPSPSA